MARYSVYNYTTRTYDYYEGSGPGGTHAGAPPLVMGGEIGVPPEGAAWRVPIGAKKVGSGDLPQGKIATLGGVPLGGGAGTLVAGAALAYLAWRILR